MQLCVQLLLVFVSYSTLVLRSLCQTINPHQSLNPLGNRCYSFRRITNLYSILSTLSKRMIPTSKISTTMLSNRATSSITTYRTHCGDRPRKLRLASSFDWLVPASLPPTHTSHNLLKKLDQNRTAYTVQQKPFIRFPHLPNRAPCGAPLPIAWTTTVRLIQM